MTELKTILPTTFPVVIQRYIFRFCGYRALAAVAAASRDTREFVEGWRESSVYMMLLVERDIQSLIKRIPAGHQAMEYRLYMALYCVLISGDMSVMRHVRHCGKISDILDVGTGLTADESVGEQLAHPSTFLAAECGSIDLLRCSRRKLRLPDVFAPDPPVVEREELKLFIARCNDAILAGGDPSSCTGGLHKIMLESLYDIFVITRNVYPKNISGMIDKARGLYKFAREFGIAYTDIDDPPSLFSPVAIGEFIDNYKRLGIIDGSHHFGWASHEALYEYDGYDEERDLDFNNDDVGPPIYDEAFYREFIEGKDKIETSTVPYTSKFLNSGKLSMSAPAGL